MHPLLEKVLETKSFLSSKNVEVEINSETSKGQCEFLQQIISENGFKDSIEIGFAFGISTLAITEEIVKNHGQHVVIDKFQKTGWAGMGLDLVSQAGYSEQVEFFEEYCYAVLPKLLEQDRRFDFAYIDSTKQFDWLLVDFFYLDKLIKQNGIIVFDDVSFPGIRKMLRYISQFPNYKIYQAFPVNSKMDGSSQMLSALRYLPKSSLFLKQDIIKTDFEMGINAHCVALQKVDNDNRNWDWHKDF